MRTYFNAFLLLAFCTAQLPASAPQALANGITAKPKKAAVQVIRHKRLKVVADYDGTPIVLRRARPVVLSDYGGVVVLDNLREAHRVPRAAPTHYFNGQPVRSFERRWSRL